MRDACHPPTPKLSAIDMVAPSSSPSSSSPPPPSRPHPPSAPRRRHRSSFAGAEISFPISSAAPLALLVASIAFVSLRGVLLWDHLLLYDGDSSVVAVPKPTASRSIGGSSVLNGGAESISAGGVGGRTFRRGDGAEGSASSEHGRDAKASPPRRRTNGVNNGEFVLGQGGGGAGGGSDGPSLGPDAPPGSILPNVLLIGGQKSGTTALAEYLFATMGVCGPRRFPGEPEHFAKEGQFFDQNERYSKGTAFWATRFEHCREDREGKGDDVSGRGVIFDSGALNGTKTTNENLKRWTQRQLVMDASPNYLPFAERVLAAYNRLGPLAIDSLRILLVLRDPIARELSLYNHKANLYRSGGPSSQEGFWRNVVSDDGESLLTFGEFARKTVLRRLSTGKCNGRKFHRMQCYGLYARHLAQWMQYFRHDQILVLSYEELSNDPERLAWRVRSFLGVEEQQRHSGDKGAIAASRGRIPPKNQQEKGGFKVRLMPCNIRNRLEEAFHGPNEDLYDLLDAKNGPEMEQSPFPKFKPAGCAAMSE